jgi:predicted PurR-regulated permease PerM
MNDAPKFIEIEVSPPGPATILRGKGRGAPRWPTIGIFLVLMAGILFVAEDFLVPLVLAFLLALVFSPVVRFLARRGLPHGVVAAGIVAMLLLAGISAVYFLSGPVGQWINDAPSIAYKVERRIAGFIGPVRGVIEASERVEEAANQSNGSQDEDVQEVVVRGPSLLTTAVTGAPKAVAQAVFTLALLFFLLASGQLFYEKTVRAMPTLTDKKRALKIVYGVERELSRYLFTITLINAGLGVAVGAVMWATGMPNPVLWGVGAAILNFIPYFGAIVGVAVSALVAMVTFESLGPALVVPLLYLALTTLEGQLLTPAVVGRRLEMNAVAVFLAVAFWGWMWGVMGALMAVPILVALRVFSHHVPQLANLGEFLAGREPLEAREEAAAEGQTLSASDRTGPVGR